MLNYPLVSIVLATYNGEKFLQQQLDSLLAQTYKNIEIIAVDDVSTDNTVAILNQFAARHPNMKVIVNETNLGFIKNFDKGCSLASGELIAPCDQDDYWDETKIEKLVAHIGSSPMIYCDSFTCDHNLDKTGKKISDLVNCQPFNNCLQQAIFCRIYGHASLFTKKLYKAATPFLNIIPHDWWLSFCATTIGEIQFFPEALVYYRQHSSNLFGVVGVKRKNKPESKQEKKQIEQTNIRTRIKTFYQICPQELTVEKQVLSTLVKCYGNFSIKNNITRFLTFLRYRDTFLIVKKHSAMHRFFFCFKMFYKIK